MVALIPLEQQRGCVWKMKIAQRPVASFGSSERGGLIQSGTYSWMVPEGNEVKLLMELST